MDFTGFYSSIILNLRGGILASIGDFPESLSQQILVGIMLAGRLGVTITTMTTTITTTSLRINTNNLSRDNLRREIGRI